MAMQPQYMQQHASMPVTTTFTIEGYRIRQYMGIVRGIIVRAPTISQGILGGLKSIVGGKIGANAIVGLRYDASEIGGKASSSTEVLCYGTAVMIEPDTE